MHEWHTNTSTNLLKLIEEFEGFEFQTDYNDRISVVSRVNITGRNFTTVEEARDFVTNSSYGGNTAYLATISTKKVSKGYQNAYNSFMEKYKDYNTFNKNLNIGYGRKASKVTCPQCGSSISLTFGGKYKDCPVCHSTKIISDSNWKMLDTKRKLCQKASQKLSEEAAKNNVVYICGIEWHC